MDDGTYAPMSRDRAAAPDWIARLQADIHIEDPEVQRDISELQTLAVDIRAVVQWSGDTGQWV